MTCLCKNKFRFKRKPVKIGSVNSDFAIISEGLKENEELALTDPYLNKEEIKAQKQKQITGLFI